MAARQFLILGLATWGLIRFDSPWIWIPLAFVQGFTVFNFTVLLHEVLHHLVFETRHPRAERLLALAYAIPSGISATQFTRWHLDHHAELGSSSDDPKRHHLSPKINARWFKLLYATPALFPIYFRAARKETATYPRCAARDDSLVSAASSIAFHLGAIALLWWAFGGAAALRAHVIPVFFVFPIAFTLNRLGQHYDIDPTDPAKWGTLMRGSWFWDFVFINSNYHLEHHYFPGVPLLQPADAPARAAAVLREERHALADLRWTGLRLARAQPGAAHGLVAGRVELQSRPKAQGSEASGSFVTAITRRADSSRRS